MGGHYQERMNGDTPAPPLRYALEGHVPAADVHKLLKQKPKAVGIAVPGMPVGSPGMDGPEYGGRKDPYEVLLITKNLMNSDVSTRTFTSYR